MDNYLVIYDIADNKRLSRAASIILDYGIRIQKSVYEVHLNSHSLEILKNRLSNVIDPKEDGLKIFHLCESCLSKKISIGSKLEEFTCMDPWKII